MNRKGYTLIEMIVTIALIALVAVLATFALSNHLNSGRNKSFKVIVNSMEDGVLEAYTSCIVDVTSSNFCTNHPLPGYGERDTIRLEELVNEGFVEKIKNPWNTNELCNKNDSYVTVTRQNATNNDYINFTYQTCLICGSHNSTGCNM